MKFFVYVLRSDFDGKHYIGQTAEIARRLAEHNRGIVRSTKSRRPWKLIYREEFKTRSEAIRGEHFLKSPKGWIELQKIKELGRGFPEGHNVMPLADHFVTNPAVPTNKRVSYGDKNSEENPPCRRQGTHPSG